jgi:hypothetical protein
VFRAPLIIVLNLAVALAATAQSPPGRIVLVALLSLRRVPATPRSTVASVYLGRGNPPERGDQTGLADDHPQ